MSSRGPSVVFTGALLALTAWALWEARGWPVQASLMAWLIGLPTAALLALQLAREILGAPDRADPAPGREEGFRPAGAAGPGGAADADPAEERRRTAAIIGWVLGFAAAIWLAGFQFGVALATLLYLRSAGEGWLTAGGVTAGVLAAVVLVFDCGMHVFFAEGKLLVWTGLGASPVFTSFCHQVSSLFGG